MSDRLRMIEELKKALAQVESWTDGEFRSKQYGERVAYGEHTRLELNYDYPDDREGGLHGSR